MQKVYYNRRQIAGRIAPVVFLTAGAVIGVGATQERPAAKPLTTASLDSHEGLTIAADPWLSAERYKTAFPKKSPYAAGVLAIKVTMRNDSDDSIRVGLERIRLNLSFDENSRQELPPLTSEQLADAVLRPKAKTPSKSRLPLPLPTSSGGRDKNWDQYQKQAEEARLHAGVVAPHSTSEGLLYFDLGGQFDLMSNARLYVPNLVALEKNRELMYFDVDLSRPASH